MGIKINSKLAHVPQDPRESDPNITFIKQSVYTNPYSQQAKKNIWREPTFTRVG